jgi:hypothetical protein
MNSRNWTSNSELELNGASPSPLLTGFYNLSDDSVLQLETCPELNPLRNQRLRCSELPCVNESGTT